MTSAGSDFLTALCTGWKRCHTDAGSLVVAVSGGADSVALLRGLVELRHEFSLTLHAAHLNHKLRGAASDEDAAWVAGLCESLGVPVEVGSVDEAALRPGDSALEETARNLRHRFLDEVATKFGCSAIALAHTADDQSETVLHHLLRGTGLAGLRGIPQQRPTPAGLRFVRPLLHVRRELIERYLAELGQGFRSDATNADVSLTRNRLRHVVLPLLREQLNPEVDAALDRLAQQAEDLEEIIHEQTDRLLECVLLDAQPNICRLDVRGLIDQPRHLVREVFRMLWQRQQWPRQAMGFTEWDRLAEIALTSGSTHLPGSIEARRVTDVLMTLSRR